MGPFGVHMKLKITLFVLLAGLGAACNIPRGPALVLPTPPALTNPAPQVTNELASSATQTSPTPMPQATNLPLTVDDFFARCPTAEEIAAINRDLTLKFEGDPTAGTLACKASEGSADLTPLQKRAYQSVLIMQQLHFDQPLPWTDKSLYQWFTSTIKGMRFSKDFSSSYCCDPPDVIDIKVADNSYLMLTDRWIDPSIGGGLQDTMVLYVHEARHNEGFPHTCSNGQDDKTIAELGAWGVQYDLLLWLAQHGEPGFLVPREGNPNSYRLIALSDAMDIQSSRFCGEPTATSGPPPTLVP